VFLSLEKQTLNLNVHGSAGIAGLLVLQTRCAGASATAQGDTTDNDVS
jgi:hypothetical protein